MRRVVFKSWLPGHLLTVLPAILSLLLAGVFIAISGQFLWSVALFLGIIAGSLVDIDHRFRGRLRFMLWVLPAFFMVTVTIQWIRHMPILLTLFMTLLAFAMTYLGALDARYRTIAFGTLVAALYALLIYQLQLAWYVNPLLILAGTFLYQIVSLGVQLAMPNHPVQMRLAVSYRALAAFIDAKADFFDPDEMQSFKSTQIRLANCNLQVIKAFNEAREALFRRLEGGRVSKRTRRQLRDYVIAQDIHERLNSSHVDYQTFAEKWRHSDVIFRIQRMIRLQAQTTRHMAQALEQGEALQATGRLTRAMAGLQAALTHQLTNRDEEIALRRLIDNLAQVNAQIRTLTNTHEADIERSIASAQVTGLTRAIHILQSNFTLKSRYFRHALRMGLLTGLIAGVVESLQLNFGYWILLTTIFVIQPNFSATKERLRHRIIGTLLGVMTGSFLALLELDALTQMSIMVFANACFFYFVRQNYSVSTMFLTIQVIMGFSLLGIHVEATLWPRLLYTCFGSALAWGAVVYLWPDWRYFNLGETVHNALSSAANYLLAIMQAFANSSEQASSKQAITQKDSQANSQTNSQTNSQASAQDMDYRSARRLAHERATELSQLVHEMALFPHSYQAEIPLANALLTQHFKLLSDVSALGAARETASGLDKNLLRAYIEHGRALSDRIANLEHYRQGEVSLIPEHLADSLTNNVGSFAQQEDLLTQQFRRIEMRLVALAALLTQLDSDKCPHYHSVS